MKMFAIVDRSAAVVVELGEGMGRRCIGPDSQENLAEEDMLTCWRWEKDRKRMLRSMVLELGETATDGKWQCMKIRPRSW